jgi:3-hydroxyisobutyrate dehydrogenase
MTANEVAFLGMGIMGRGMARNIARNHKNLRIWNRTKHDWLRPYGEEIGAQLFDSVGDAVNGAEIIFTCLTGPNDVKSALLGPGGIASAASKNAIVVDCSTIGPIAAREIAQSLKEHELNFLDAPVSGGDVGATNGTLTFMVGGAIEHFERCLPYFDAMGKITKLCGPVGAGQSVKLCNQVLCAINLIGVCEALNLATKLDLDPELIVDVCGSGAGGSWSLSNLGPRIIGGEYGPGFMVKDMLKDLGFVVDLDSDLSGVNLAIGLFERAKAKAGRGADRLGTHVMARAYLSDQ